MANINKILKKYGLSDHEAKVYVASLKLVESTAYIIASEAELPRTSTYTALESLRSKGLMISGLRNNVRYYTPENPNVLVQELENKKTEITEILPELNSLIDMAKIVPTVKLYRGKEGYIKVRNEMLECFKKDKIRQIYVISSPLDFDLFPKYFPNWVAQRKKQGVLAKTFLRHDSQKHKHFQLNQTDLREAKYLPSSFHFDGTMNIYGDKITFFALKEDELFSVIIDSPALTEMLKQFFKFSWSLVKGEN